MKVGDSVKVVDHHWFHHLDGKDYIGRRGQIVSISGETYYVSMLEIEGTMGYFVDAPFEVDAIKEITFEILIR